MLTTTAKRRCYNCNNNNNNNISNNTNYNRYILLLLLLAINTCTTFVAAATHHQQQHQQQQQQITSLGVEIIRAPESAVAPKGDEVLFECELNLSPERLEWRFRSAATAAAAATSTNPTTTFQYLQIETGYNITNDERSSKLKIFVTHESLGEYQCVAWFGTAAIVSTFARLTLASIGIHNSNGYSRSATLHWRVAPKNCILIRCGTVTSNPAAVWSYYLNGEKLPTNGMITANGALILNYVTAKDSGTYSCSAMNPITGVDVKLQQQIDVRIDYMDRSPPYFLAPQQQTPIIARVGESVVLECPGVGSPPPKPVWSRPNVDNIYNNRTNVLPYGLQINNISMEDQGTYICRLDNGIVEALVHTINLTVYDRPKILHGPAATLTNEGDPLQLECLATGNPTPEIYWLINGEDTKTDHEIYHEHTRMIIKHVQKRHAGIVQCFVKNEVGEVCEGNLLHVNPKQIPGEESLPTGSEQNIRNFYEHFGGNKNNGKGRRKFTKVLNMIPPSRPNVTRLSDDSVMLRWNVPKNDGLPIQFFKVQYRMLGDGTKKIPRENWQTTNEEIRFGKRERNFEGPVKNFTSSVSGLKPDRYYRFRIIAVYSNNDNKEGNTSIKFLLHRGTDLGRTKSNLPTPELQRVEAKSESAVTLYWILHEQFNINNVMGFYAYYRPAASAGEYFKATADGNTTRELTIDLLEPGTAYEFKLQTFSMQAASEFSTILQGKTKKLISPTKSSVLNSVTTGATIEKKKTMYPVIAGAVGGGILLLLAIIATYLCIKRRKNSPIKQPVVENKPQLEHLGNDFNPASVFSVGGAQQKSGGHYLNGGLGSINITPNPLAHEADKIHLRTAANHVLHDEQHQQQPHLINRPNSPQQKQQQQQQQQQQMHQSYQPPHSPQLPHHHNQQLHHQSHQSLHAHPMHHRSHSPHSPTQTQQTHFRLSPHATHAPHLPPHVPPHSPHLPHHQTHAMHHQSHQSLQSLQPPGTPPALPKRDYQHHLQQQQHQQHAIQNGKHHGQHHLTAATRYCQQQPPIANNQQQQQPTPIDTMDLHRRTLERSRRNLQYTLSTQPLQDIKMNIDGLPTARLNSLRRNRIATNNTNNNAVGIH